MLVALALGAIFEPAPAAKLKGFQVSGQFEEQVRSLRLVPGVTVRLVAPPPAELDPRRPTTLVVYALPNGNTIEQTVGKERAEGVNRRFDIQHIGAQTRALRAATRDRNLVVAYLENDLKSRPAWRKEHSRSGELIVKILARVKKSLPRISPQICLTGHSGGGSLTFGYLEAVRDIPPDVTRIAFLDSNYNFDDELHGAGLIGRLGGDANRRLVVPAYDDRNVEMDGQKVVSESGGAYRATLRMVERLRREWALEEGESGSYVRFSAPQVEMLIHRNPENRILHSALVGEKNGFMHALTVGTVWEGKIASVEGPRAYTEWIERGEPPPRPAPDAPIPPRPSGAMGGAAFLESVQGLDREAREAAILGELRRGNIPDFLRRLVPLTVEATVLDGTRHTATFEVMPDYLAIGSDDDWVRMPMNPHTAQAFCDAFGFVLPTRKMALDIWRQSALKLTPQPLTRERESPATFLEHHRLIEEQRAGRKPGELVAGIKKDVVVTNRLQERPNRVAIYGWHYPNGEPIQPLTIVHVDWYVDYSHGVRPVQKSIRVDGVDLPYQEVLRDPHLHPLLSDEGAIETARYERAKPPCERPEGRPSR